MNLKEKISKYIPSFFDGAFKSSDSKYFIFTATKITAVPFISFCIISFSLWTIMELNFNFFVANGFESGDDFKRDFYNTIFLNISDYILYSGVVLAFIFMTGLVVSWLALRAFDHIQDFAESMIMDYDQELEVQGLNKNKLVYQVSRIFFKYMQLTIKNGKRPKFKLPKKIEQLKSPSLDFVFLIQYSLVVFIICMVTNFLLYTFTNELYQSIIQNGTSLIDTNSLEINKIVSSFLDSQKALLFNIHFVAILFNIAGYFVISRNIIKSVDGVGYGFSRDMIQIIKGDHSTRLRPRFNDPGKNMATGINHFLDEVFSVEIEEDDTTSFAEDVDSTIDEMNEIDESPKYGFQKLEDLNNEDGHTDYGTMENNLFQIKENTLEDDSEEDLPPAFIEEKQVVGGEKVFQVTAPDGTKVDGVPEELLLKMIKGSKES